MKRSEIKDRITKYVNNTIMFRDNYYKAEYYAEKILSIVEEAGMLPPYIYRIFKGTADEVKVVREYRNGLKWEKEDNEK